MGYVYSNDPAVEARTSGVELSPLVKWEKLDDLIATLLCVRDQHANKCELSQEQFNNLLKNHIKA